MNLRNISTEQVHGASNIRGKLATKKVLKKKGIDYRGVQL
jgi:hypothetical protein